MRLTPEQLTARKRRNLAIAGALVLFILLVFTATVLNLQRNVAARAELEGAATHSTRIAPAPTASGAGQ